MTNWTLVTADPAMHVRIVAVALILSIIIAWLGIVGLR
jgi:hypothetical protein